MSRFMSEGGGSRYEQRVGCIQRGRREKESGKRNEKERMWDNTIILDGGHSYGGHSGARRDP